MLRGIYGDHDRYVETYWSRFPDVYFTGDGAKLDEDGDFWLMGRVDDVMNVSGHRISTIEVESALVDHLSVAEAAVCGRADATTGQAIVAFVSLKEARTARSRSWTSCATTSRRRSARSRVRRTSSSPRAAEDTLRQDHAPAAPRRLRAPGAGRYDYPRGSDGVEEIRDRSRAHAGRLASRTRAYGRYPARHLQAAAEPPTAPPSSRDPHSGHSMPPSAAWSTNSPQARHSRLAPALRRGAPARASWLS